MVDLVAQSGIADLVEAHELIEAVAATVWHEQPMKGHSEARLAERLDRLRLARILAPANTDLSASVGYRALVTKRFTGRPSRRPADW